MFRVTRLRGSILGFVPFFLFVAIFISLLGTATHDAHAIRGKVVDAGTGSGYYGLPGQGDDDQPTITPTPARRTTVQMSEPDAQSSGSGTPSQTASLRTVRRIIENGRDFVRRLFTVAR